MEPSHGRVLAMQALYEHDAARHPAGSVFERLRSEAGSSDDDVAVARHLIEGVLSHVREIDAEISQAAPTWPVAQLPGVDRAILRLAIFETLFDNCAAPAGATNEARALALSFGSESSSKFVHGVLSALLDREESQRRPERPSRGLGG